jgi:hypothetical protein
LRSPNKISLFPFREKQEKELLVLAKMAPSLLGFLPGLGIKWNLLNFSAV